MDTAECCENPMPGYGAPPPDGDGKIDAICLNCGHNHGKMTLKKANDLFTRPMPDE